MKLLKWLFLIAIPSAGNIYFVVFAFGGWILSVIYRFETGFGGMGNVPLFITFVILVILWIINRIRFGKWF